MNPDMQKINITKLINMWVVSDEDEDDRGRVLRLCGTCVLVARVCSANCDLNSFHLPSCPRLSLLSIIPLPSCALLCPFRPLPLSFIHLREATPEKIIFSFGHCLNWRRPPTQIYVDPFLQLIAPNSMKP